MIKLLNAGFTRLKKDKLFWSLSIFVVILALFTINNGCLSMEKYKEVVTIDRLFFYILPVLGILSAVFISVFLGNEYASGTIRNKIIIGHSRYKIYLSNFILCGLVTLFYVLLFMVILVVIGIPIFGGIQMTMFGFLILLLDSLALGIAYSSIFTFIAMLCSNKTATAITCILIAIGMLFFSIILISIIETPKMIPSYELIEGEMVSKEVPNPRYPSDAQRRICQTIIDINPAGQSLEIVGRETNFKILSVYSLGIIILFTSAGLLLFQRKELK